MAYADESFSDDWYVMAALLRSGPAVLIISAGIDQVLEWAATDHGVPKGAERMALNSFRAAANDYLMRLSYGQRRLERFLSTEIAGQAAYTPSIIGPKM